MNPKGIRFSPEQRNKMREEAVKAYTDGATISQVAEKLGCSAGTVQLFLAESGVQPRPRNHHRVELPEGMLTSPETAALIGIGHPSFNAMRHRGDGPPQAERPAGAHGHYTYYWRRDVEQWMTARAERQAERARRAERNRELRASRTPVVGYAPDWAVLLADVDSKRKAEDLTWESVCRLSGASPFLVSRIRNGKAGNSWGTFLRLLSWLQNGLPEPVREYIAETRSAEAT